MQKEIVKNTSIYIGMGFFTQGIIFLLWIILARFIDPSQIGTYVLAMFVFDFLGVISVLGLDSAMTRFYHSEHNISSVLTNSLFIVFISNFLTIVFFLLISFLIPRFIPGLSDILKENLFLFVAVIFSVPIGNFFLTHYIALKKALSYVKLNVFQTVLFVILSFILVKIGMGIVGVIYSYFISYFLIVVIFLLKERKLLSFKLISSKIIKKLTSYGIPLMIYGAIGIFIGYFSRILLDKYTTLEVVGIYGFFLIITSQVNGLWGSFNRAWTPEIFSKLLKDKEKTLADIEYATFFLSFAYLLIFFLLVVVGKTFLFRFIFKEIYLSNIYILYILLLAPLFTSVYTVCYPLYYYENKTKRIMFISLLISGINLLLTLFLVNYFGQTGAAVIYLMMSALTLFIYSFVFKKIARIPAKIINWSYLLVLMSSLSVLMLLMYKSSFLFLLPIILTIFMAYKMGNLYDKKYLLLDVFNIIKNKIN